MGNPRGDSPLFSVLMSTYNRADRLPLAIRSIVKQQYPHWELILVNDGGEDVSRIANSFLSKRITLLNFEDNKGKSAAINEAFRHAKGEFIAYLDDDDQWLPNHLRTHFERYDLNPEAMFHHSDTHRIVLERDRRGNEKEASRNLLYDAPVGFRDFIARNRITWLSVTHRRECFAAVGGLDERLRILVDFDLWRRMAARYEFHHIPEHTGDYFIHRQIDGQMTGLVRKDPLAFLYANALIQRKAVPPDLARLHSEELSAARQKAYVDFLTARAEEFHSRGNERRRNAALSLAAKIRGR
ncbi:UDP-Glc:alpha-D-GlcNAc-diphosphoundecaprenol beta-1,3-glucosyltransferase WfgD [Pseudodesulfovibrio hydrargyri]|uniref:UDP-Glc:alpha-D-GlcNAc-diphosphoundecaprenol beta-1,3-glucosyltransferase WfgD n=1 Tax=Pseudodesulfovibrio hydrargyri TaxID=2125990 RepID=A0A1J5N0L8_9BACT|nr:glycosyltransferase family 2 protein [Pseudodesulfovibrio hydrargyri]OIQ51660.1 UDP-Glc:alpha-D-GlcNAc-diphosphoundecaprenol beta-1,3-glucosyltransferase WfgD [Pseudodesulfovibrio hydrargyri]